MKRKVFVDFDGTLATQQTNGYHREIGEPIRPMIEIIKQELKNGSEVKIFTARASQWHDELEKIDIERFCVKYFGQILPITALKEHYIDVYYDDRAIQVEKNTGKLINERNTISY